jgi:hypothetical protein
MYSSEFSSVYSTTEFYAPIYSNSTHTKKLDIQRNSAIRIIEGTLKWLPVPPQTSEENRQIRNWTENANNPNLLDSMITEGENCDLRPVDVRR